MELKTRLAFARVKMAGGGWFYPFARQGERVVGLTTNPDLAHSASFACNFRTGMSGCRDEQMAIKLDSYPAEIRLPHSWHYTMSGYLEGDQYFIADIPEPHPDDWEETKLLRIHGLVSRAMSAIYGYLEPVEHAIIHRAQFSWENPIPEIHFKTLNGDCSIIPNPVTNRAFVTIAQIMEEELFIWNHSEESIYFSHEKDGPLTAKLFRRTCQATGRQFWAGMAMARRGCNGFEEGQSNCVLLGGEKFFKTWHIDDESRRLGDYFFGSEYCGSIKALNPLTPPQLWASKLEYVGDEGGGILFHPDHGGIKIAEYDHAFALQYEVQGHD